MLAALTRLPLLVALMAVSAALMLLPAAHAAVVQDYRVARVFFYSALIFGFLTLFLAIATAGRPETDDPRRHLLTLLGLYCALPLMLAVPFQQAVGDTSFLNAYVEMVSSLTTTGATLFETPGRLAPSVHLWRASVGWFGGLILWVAAVAILAPMALGGFEVQAAPGEEGLGFPGGTARGVGKLRGIESARTSMRLGAHTRRLAPLYAGLTLLLWIGLFLAGDRPLVALIHAMSTMATSGISPAGGLAGGGAGLAGEAMVAIFLVFAISRLAFARDGRAGEARRFAADPEVRLGAGIVVLVTAALFLRHWIGAYEVDEEANFAAGLRALWGTAFTVLSFLTTAGFVSADWAGAQGWSGLESQGLVLLGLALIGGGVATTAGGAKLLRVHALYKHSRRELERLILPSSVGGAGRLARHIRTRGAFRAWIFFMLTALAAGGFMLAFALAGEAFETSLILTLAGLTTTGPLAQWAGAEPVSYALLGTGAKLILSAAMIMGRLETLAIVALLNPELWRR